MITEFFADYLFVCVFFLIIEAGICWYYKKNGIKLKAGFIIGWQLLVLLLTAMFSVTGAGTVTDIGKFGDEIIRLDEISLIPFRWGSAFGLVMNVVMFVPFGVALPMLWKEKGNFLPTAAAGFTLSLLIEISQLFNRRATDIDDLIMNTLGTVIGYLFYKLIFKRITIFQIDNDNDKCFIKYGALWSILIIFFFSFFIGRPLIKFIWFNVIQ